MLGKSSNPSRKLTKKDKDILDKYYEIHIANIKHLIKNYPNPKSYAIKVLSRKHPKKYDMDLIKTLIFTKSIYPSTAFRPRDLDKFLKSNQLNNKVESNQSNDLFLNDSDSSRYLNSRQLWEGVLKKLKEQGFIHKSNKKLDYKNYIKKEIKKNESKFVAEDEGGPRLIYRISEEIKNINEILSNPLCMAYLNDKIIMSGYAEKFTAYLLFLLFYMMKTTEQQSEQLENIGNAYFDRKMTDTKRTEVEYTNEIIKILTDEQLEVFCNRQAEWLIREKKDYNFINLFSLIDS